MSDIGQLMALQQRINEQEREDIRNIGRTVGDIFAQRGQRSFEKNAIDFFTREGVSPQAINQFQSMYPHVPATLIYHWAGEIGKQQEAQDMKDMFASFQSAVANIKDPSELTPELVAGVVKNPAYLPKFVEFFKMYKDLYPDVKWLPLGEGEQQFQTIGGKPTGEVISGKERANVSIFNTEMAISKKVTRTEADKLIDTGKWTEGKPIGLTTGTEETYNPKTGITYGRPYKILPNGTQVYTGKSRPIKGKEIKGREIKERGIKEKKAEKKPTFTERRLFAEAISEAEGDILANSADEDMSAQVDFFNQNANTSHIYLWQEVKWGRDKWIKTKLPVINGRQVKAKDVQDTADKHNLSYEEVLKRINAKAPFLSKKNP